MESLQAEEKLKRDKFRGEVFCVEFWDQLKLMTSVRHGDCFMANEVYENPKNCFP